MWKNHFIFQDDTFQFGKNGHHSLHPLHSAFYPHLMALSLCFTSLNEGFLYHLPGHLRKPGRGCGVQKISTYPFTSPVSKIALEPTLLHALTQTGWVSRHLFTPKCFNIKEILGFIAFQKPVHPSEKFFTKSSFNLNHSNSYLGELNSVLKVFSIIWNGILVHDSQY